MANGDKNEKPLSIHKIMAALRESPIFDRLNTDWEILASGLQLQGETVDKLRVDILANTLSPTAILEEVLCCWQLKCGKKATLVSLIKVMHDTCGWLNICEKLKSTVKTIGDFEITEQTTWTSLKKCVRWDLLGKEVHFLGSIRSVYSITRNINAKVLRKMMDTSLTAETLKYLASSDEVVLARNTVPDLVPCYVARQLVRRTRLDPAIFSHPTADIFVVHSKDRTVVSRLAESCGSVGRSSEELKKLRKSRVIFLEERSHYEAICETEEVPVHLIQYSMGSYFWEKTAGNVTTILKSLNEQQRGSTMDELQFVNLHLKKHSPDAVCITGKLGLGKSTLLAKRAKMIQETYPERFVIFINMKTIAEQLETRGNVPITKEDIFKGIANLVSENAKNPLGNRLLLEILTNSTAQIELFLDGYDEAYFEQQHVSRQICRELVKSCPNVRCFVASGSGVNGEEIETLFGTISYSIMPFTSSEKIQFLTDYWSRKFEFKRHQDLKKLALSGLHLLAAPTTKQTDAKQVPLLLWLLAEVLGHDIEENKCPGTIDHYKTFTRFKLVQTFLHRTFGKYDDGAIKSFHTRQAILSVLPKTDQHELPNLICKGTSFTDMDSVQRAGLLRPSWRQGEWVFNHKTIAEYLVAEYFVQLLAKENGHNKSTAAAAAVMHDLASIIFQTKKSNDKNKASSLQHPSLCYFVDELLQQFHMPSTFPTYKMASPFISNLDDILKACLSHHYYGLFCFVTRYFLTSDPQRIGTSLINSNKDDWMDTLAMATRFNILDQVAKLYELSITSSPNNGTEATLGTSPLGYIPTPLHAAAERGSWSLFQYFLKKGQKLPNRLIHAAVSDSYSNQDEVIEGKLEILKYLLEPQKAVIIQEEEEHPPEPLLMERIHIKLLTYLLQVKNEASFQGCIPKTLNTLAHNVAEYLTPDEFHDVVTLLLNRGAGYLFRRRNKENKTALHIALEKTNVKWETLELLIAQKEVTTDGQFCYEDSLLYHLIRFGYSGDILDAVLKISAEWTSSMFYRDHGTTLLHVAAHWQNADALAHFLSLKGNPNAVDMEGKTPLHVACSAKDDGNIVDVVKLLLEHGANAVVQDAALNQPLFYLLVT